MIDLEFLERLIKSIDESSLDSIEIERGGTRIRLSKSAPGGGLSASNSPPASNSASSAPAAAAPDTPRSAPSASAPAPSAPSGPPPDESWIEVTSPMVGTFYRAPSPGADPFADVGERITIGQTLCIIEAMKLMNELESEVEGTVREVCVGNGEPVEYGQVLFRIEPS